MSEGQVTAYKPRITIIGAGIAGLSLACRLARIGIPFTLYEARKEQSIGHNYAVTLKRKQWRSLAKELWYRSSSQTRKFREFTACDRLVGGNGQVSNKSKANSQTFQATDRDLRKLLVKTLAEKAIQIKWNHKLVEIREAIDGQGALLRFENAEETVADIVVDSGGLSSPSFGQNLPQSTQTKLLPYATYYGTRRMSNKDFDVRYASYFGNGNSIKLLPSKGETDPMPFVSVQKIHLQDESATAETHTVELRWVFSRPPTGNSDPLYRPKRAKEEAKIIPSEFLEAVLELVRYNQYSQKMRSFVSELFNLSDIHNDRILNWHLRLQVPPHEYFRNNADRGSYEIVALGDAAHGLPILESHGARIALIDAEKLAKSLQTVYSGASRQKLGFHDDHGEYDRWVSEARSAVQRLREIHGQELLTEDDLDTLTGKPSSPTKGSVEDSDNDLSDNSEQDTGEQQQSKI